MPDADWWEQAPRDDLGELQRDVPHLEAEVRRLRSALRRIADAFGQVASWEALRVAARQAHGLAEEALEDGPASPSRAPSPGPPAHR